MNHIETAKTKPCIGAHGSNDGNALIVFLSIICLLAIAWSLLARLADLPEARKEAAIITGVIKPLHEYEPFLWADISRENGSEFDHWTLKTTQYKYAVVNIGFAPMRGEGAVQPILSAIARRCSEEIVEQMPNRKGNVHAEVVVHAFFGSTKERSVENPELATSASMGRIEN